MRWLVISQAVALLKLFKRKNCTIEVKTGLCEGRDHSLYDT
jgi:hypothetical protein